MIPIIFEIPKRNPIVSYENDIIVEIAHRNQIISNYGSRDDIIYVYP